MSDCVPIVGDTTGMRELAAALRQTASVIAACDSSASPKARSLTFTGPAAVRLQASLADWHRDLTCAVDLLAGAADQLVRAAADIDDERARLARLAGR